jgi:tRNA C32,U32 (ribose-2'-O)-methylase TrmJ
LVNNFGGYFGIILQIQCYQVLKHQAKVALVKGQEEYGWTTHSVQEVS